MSDLLVMIDVTAVWRADAITAIEHYDDGKGGWIVSVIPNDGNDVQEYVYDNEQESTMAFKSALRQWERWLNPK